MNEPANDLHLTLSVMEVNQILQALGSQAYVDVYLLINKLQQQADQQLSSEVDS